MIENSVYTFQVRPEREQAFNAELLDCNEYRVRAIHTHCGNTDVRTTMKTTQDTEMTPGYGKYGAMTSLP